MHPMTPAMHPMTLFRHDAAAEFRRGREIC